jgi:hypothetical protein
MFCFVGLYRELFVHLKNTDLISRLSIDEENDEENNASNCIVDLFC